MSDNRDYMTLHLQTFSLSVRFFLKLNYTLIRKKKHVPSIFVQESRTRLCPVPVQRATNTMRTKRIT